MFRSKKPKRIKQWINVYDGETGLGHDTVSKAREASEGSASRTAVPLIELRRGEVVVDVEALVEEYVRQTKGYALDREREALRAAIKKVGVR